MILEFFGEDRFYQLFGQLLIRAFLPDAEQLHSGHVDVVSSCRERQFHCAELFAQSVAMAAVQFLAGDDPGRGFATV